MNANAQTLRALVDLRDRVTQKNRVAFGLRADAIERGADDGDGAAVSLYRAWEARFESLENAAEKEIAALVKDIPIIQHLTALRGVGVMLAAKVVSMIDIHECDTVSSLWRFAGYAVINGQRERPRKGEKLHYNARLKTAVYLISSSFLKCSSPYRQVYDSAREYYNANRPDWTKAHCHNAAMRKMSKVFLAHLWLEWRKLEGLPTRSLYVEERLGHEHIIAPQEFGWPE
jgi:hypothetical protein